MYMVEILVPLKGEGDSREIQALAARLTDRFGGATAFLRSPADGFWKDNEQAERDKIVVIEVMVKALERRWWRHFRVELEERLDESEIVIRAHSIKRL